MIREDCKIGPIADEPAMSRQHLLNDEPQPGPSGLNRGPWEPSSMFPKRDRVIHSSDDEDSADDDRMRTSAAWAVRMNGSRPIVPKLEIESPTSTDTFIHPNEYHTSHVESGMDLLTAPDLQLDWISETSDERNAEEIEYVPSPAPQAPDIVKEEPQSSSSIDLTRDTDDEDFVRVPTSGPRLANNNHPHHHHSSRSTNSSRYFCPKLRHAGFVYSEELGLITIVSEIIY